MISVPGEKGEKMADGRWRGEFIVKDGEFIDELVRCKDCKWFEIAHLKRDGTEDKRYKSSVCVKGTFAKLRKATWFCADGERREDDRET